MLAGGFLFLEFRPPKEETKFMNGDKHLSRAGAIRQRCLDCGDGYKGTKECDHQGCQLHPYRMKPTGLPEGKSSMDRKRAIAGYCLIGCCLDQSKEVRMCPSKDCPLWPYRQVSRVQKPDGV